MPCHVPPAAQPHGEELPTPLTLDALEQRAWEILHPLSWGYMASGAGSQGTLSANLDDFDELVLSPHVLRDVSVVDTRVRLFGATHSSPLIIAPTGSHGLFHHNAEEETVLGANAADCAMVLSAYANRSLEDVSAISEQQLWMQVNATPDRTCMDRFVARANTSADALVITVDTPVIGARHAQIWDGVSLPSELSFPMFDGFMLRSESTGSIYRSGLDAGFDDAALRRLVETANVPVIVKGIQRGDDAVRAVAAGSSGIIVSNHGGRNLDSGLSTISCLPDVVQAVGGRVPVLLDGGIRRGTDVIKALALGADAVLVGRPVLWGLTVAGRLGVAGALEHLGREFAMAMALCGVKSVAEIDDDLIRRR